MVNPIRVLGNALRDLFDEALLLLVCNLLWVAFCVPLWWLASTLAFGGAWIEGAALALLGVLPAGPATAGLVYVAYRVADGRASKISDFFVGLRQYARAGWMLTAIWVTGLILIIINLSFWIFVTNLLGAMLLALWLYVLLFWLGTLIYAPALVVLQEQPNLRTIARNTVLMFIGRPIFSLITLTLMGIVFFLSNFLILPFFMITMALFALWGMRATMAQVADARRRREAADADAVVPAEERGRKGQVRPK